MNCFALESTLAEGGWFEAGFANGSTGVHLAGLKIVFADEISAATLNGAPLILEKTGEGSHAALPSPLPAENRLRFRPIRTFPHAFAWVHGHFRVSSVTPFFPGPGETVKTDGPFTLLPPAHDLPRDLIAGGFPFLREPLQVTAEVEIPAGKGIRLEGLFCDAVRLDCDGQDLGWTWRRGGETRFSFDLTPGRRRLRLTMIPNTYNAFGPHHYYQGDWFIISPDQIRGVRNFADLPGASKQTHIFPWHFRRLELPTGITLGRSEARSSA